MAFRKSVRDFRATGPRSQVSTPCQGYSNTFRVSSSHNRKIKILKCSRHFVRKFLENTGRRVGHFSRFFLVLFSFFGLATRSLERRETEDSSSRRIKRLVPVFILETNNKTNN